MGYTHYWDRRESLDPQKFAAFTKDFKRLIPALEDMRVYLANGHGEGAIEISDAAICFNGLEKCGHAEEDLGIAWPASKAGGISTIREGVQVAGTWFGGAQLQKRACGGDCSHGTFSIELIERNPEHRADEPLVFNCCKTAYKPYDIAVTAALIIFKHHFKGDVFVKSDGNASDWFDAALLCHKTLGYGLSFTLDTQEAQDAYEQKIRAQEAPAKAKKAADAFALEVIAIKAENPKLKEGKGYAIAAANIRKQLKAAFPGVKFSVRSKSYSGGDNIDIRWTDGPTVRDVEAISNKYEGGSFDGMTDSYSYHSSAWNETFCSSKYIHTSRQHSRAFLEAVLTKHGLIGKVLRIAGSDEYGWWAEFEDRSDQHWAGQYLSQEAR